MDADPSQISTHMNIISRKKTFFFYSALLYLLVLPVQALKANTVNAGFVHYGNNSDIRTIYAHNDTLWLGTNGGVVLYDLLLEETAGRITTGRTLPSNSIRMITGKANEVYVGTDKGLSIFGQNRISVYSRKQCRCFEDIRSITFGSDGAVFLGLFGRGASILRGGSLNVITKADSLIDNNVFAVFPDGEETVYFGTSMGLCAFKDSAWVSYQAGFGIPRGSIKSIARNDDGTIFFIVGKKGIYGFNGRRATRVPLRGIFDDNDIAAFTISSDQTLWAAGRYGRIAAYRYGDWTVMGDEDPDIRGAKWRCAFSDSSGNVYFGSAEGMFVKIAEGKIRKFELTSSLPSNHIEAIEKYSSGHMLVSCGSELLLMDGTGMERIDLPGAPVTIAVSADGTALVSTRWGIFREMRDGFLPMIPPARGMDNYILSTIFDHLGQLWAGSLKGDIFRNDGDFWLLCGSADEIGIGPVEKLAVDRFNRIWALGRQNEVSTFDGRKWTTMATDSFETGGVIDMTINGSGMPLLLTRKHLWSYRDKIGWIREFGPAPNSVGECIGVVEDEDGRFYIGAQRGLMLISGSFTRIIGSEDGISSERMVSALIDDGGILWLGFDNDGLYSIPIRNLW